MTPYTSESRLISLYMKYLYGLLMQRGHIEMILMGRISARKQQSTGTASHMQLNCSECITELLF
jgi:hypothetical protein